MDQSKEQQLMIDLAISAARSLSKGIQLASTIRRTLATQLDSRPSLANLEALADSGLMRHDSKFEFLLLHMLGGFRTPCQTSRLLVAGCCEVRFLGHEGTTMLILYQAGFYKQ